MKNRNPIPAVFLLLIFLLIGISFSVREKNFTEPETKKIEAGVIRFDDKKSEAGLNSVNVETIYHQGRGYDVFTRIGDNYFVVIPINK